MYKELQREELVELRSANLSGIAEGGIRGTEECICIRNF